MINIKKLRTALRAKYGARCYRITRTGDVHIYSPAPRSIVVCWWLMGSVEDAYMWLGLDNMTIYWRDGDTTNAIEASDFEQAADILGCELDEVNQCSEGQLDAYGVTLATDPYKRPKGLAN